MQYYHLKTFLAVETTSEFYFNGLNLDQRLRIWQLNECKVINVLLATTPSATIVSSLDH